MSLIEEKINLILASTLNLTKGKVIRKNLITNPNFETANSLGVVAVTGSLSTTWSLSGNSWLLTPTGTSKDSYGFIGGGDVGAMRLGMKPGGTYTVSATVYVPTARVGLLFDDRWGKLNFFYKNALGSYIEAKSDNPVIGTPTLLSVTVSIPIDATEAFIRLYNGSNNVNDLVYWDNILLEESSSEHPYFDGNFDYARWTGLANASPSEYLSCSAMDILHDYWASRSGLVPASTYSIMDHCKAAGGSHYLKDVT